MPVTDASVLVSWQAGDSNFTFAYRWALTSIVHSEAWDLPVIAIAELAAGMNSVVRDSALTFKGLESVMGYRHLRLHGVDQHLATIAAHLAVDHGIRACDAVYVALAKDLGVPLVTFDRQQAAGAAAAGVSVVIPSSPT